MFWKNEKKCLVELYREQVVKCYNDFSKLNFAEILSQLIANETKSEAPLYQFAILSKIQNEKHNLFFVLTICKYYFNYKKEIFVTYDEYLSLLEEMVNSYDDMIYNKHFEKGEKIQEAYVTVINNFNIHISEINIFYRHIYIVNQKKN